MKLNAIVFVTLDNVYQGPCGPDEDVRGGFERGGWQASHAGEDYGAFIMSTYERADALLLGRVTWEIWERARKQDTITYLMAENRLQSVARSLVAGVKCRGGEACFKIASSRARRSTNGS